MDIVFGYIEGLTDIDTPYFASQAKQEEYFYSHAVETIETSFYPPHYTNRIIVDTEDIDLNTNINYCWFEYNEKIYYYFIDSIEYISEDTIALNIYMDVIQTFYFNIYVQDAYIEREHINRWKHVANIWTINRDYIRENVSANEMEYESKVKVDSWDNNMLWLVIKVTEPGTVQSKFASKIYHGIDYIIVPYGIFVLPLGIKYIEYHPTGGVTQYKTVNYEKIAELLSDNRILDFYITKRNPYNDTFIVYGDVGSLILSVGQDPSFYGDYFVRPKSTEYNDGGFYTYYMCDIAFRQVSAYTYTLPVTRNTNYNSSINVESYETVMIDENYFRISYGDITNESVIPTHYIKRVDIGAYVICDFDGGADIYYLYDFSSRNYQNNIYGVAESSQVKLTMQLINDAYKTYAANNGSRWMVAGLKAGKNIISAALGMYGMASYSSGAVTSTSKTQYIRGGNVTSERISNRSVKSESMRDYDRGNTTRDAIEGVGPITDQAMRDLNAIMAPSSTRNTGTAISDILSLHANEYFITYKCRDYKQCAMYYHRYGYKVDRFVSNINNIFNEVNHRFYFNILKLKDSNIHLHNIIEDEKNTLLVKERLENGIRLWNTYNQKITSPLQTILDNDIGSVVINMSNTSYNRFESDNPNVTITSTSYSVVNHSWTINVQNNSHETQTYHIIAIKGYGGETIGEYIYDNVEKDFIN